MKNSKRYPSKQLEILTLIKRHPGIHKAKILAISGINEKTVSKWLNFLKEQNTIEARRENVLVKYFYMGGSPND